MRPVRSVGAHVRDAAAFACWALARAYSGREVAGAVAVLAPALLAAAAYDREVNCRRAAAAAFQARQRDDDQAACCRRGAVSSMKEVTLSNQEGPWWT